MSVEAQAALLLRLYELRREASLREARSWFVTRFEPRNAAEIVELMRSGFAESAKYRMVTTYWDMACSLVAHGAIGAELFQDSNTEHLAVYAKLEPHLDGVRAAFGSPAIWRASSPSRARRPAPPSTYPRSAA